MSWYGHLRRRHTWAGATSIGARLAVAPRILESDAAATATSGISRASIWTEPREVDIVEMVGRTGVICNRQDETIHEVLTVESSLKSVCQGCVKRYHAVDPSLVTYETAFGAQALACWTVVTMVVCETKCTQAWQCTVVGAGAERREKYRMSHKAKCRWYAGGAEMLARGNVRNGDDMRRGWPMISCRLDTPHVFLGARLSPSGYPLGWRGLRVVVVVVVVVVVRSALEVAGPPECLGPVSRSSKPCRWPDTGPYF
jgi:hypothetical protein